MQTKTLMEAWDYVDQLQDSIYDLVKNGSIDKAIEVSEKYEETIEHLMFVEDLTTLKSLETKLYIKKCQLAVFEQDCDYYRKLEAEIVDVEEAIYNARNNTRVELE